MELKIKKKHVAAITLICLILAAGFVAANQDLILRLANPDPVNIPLPGRLVGHSSADVVVNMPGCLANDDISLQEAIDNGCFGGVSFGDWNPRNTSQNYTAATDGIVVAYTTRPGNPGVSPTKIRVESPVGIIRNEQQEDNQGNNQYLGVSSPVKKGDSWTVIVSGDQPGGPGSNFVYWISLIKGSGGGGEASLPPCIDNQFLQYVAGSWQCVDGIPGSLAFGTRVSTDTSGDDLVVNVVYQAQTDGFFILPLVGGPNVSVNVGSTNPPTNILGRHTWSGDTTYGTISVPVPKNEYVQITGGGSVQGTPNIWWQPIGAGGLDRLS